MLITLSADYLPFIDLYSAQACLPFVVLDSQGLMGVLTRLASSSKLAVRTLFELSISRTLSDILIGSDVSHNSAVVSTEDVQNSQVSVLYFDNLLIRSTYILLHGISLELILLNLCMTFIYQTAVYTDVLN